MHLNGEPCRRVDAHCVEADFISYAAVSIESWPTLSIFADTKSTRTCPATIAGSWPQRLLAEDFEWLNP
jgi:hypothetical protein